MPADGPGAGSARGPSHGGTPDTHGAMLIKTHVRWYKNALLLRSAFMPLSGAVLDGRPGQPLTTALSERTLWLRQSKALSTVIQVTIKLAPGLPRRSKCTRRPYHGTNSTIFRGPIWY
eukprot:6194256-Pleurochrysis_carterae.AAC.3